MEHNKLKKNLLKEKLKKLNINSVSSSLPIDIKNKNNSEKIRTYHSYNFNFPEFNSFDEKKIYTYSNKCSEGGNFPPIHSPTPPDEKEYMKNYYMNYIANHQLKIQK